MKDGFNFVFGEKTDFDFTSIPDLKLEVRRRLSTTTTSRTLELVTLVSSGWFRWIHSMILTTKTAGRDDIMDPSPTDLTGLTGWGLKSTNARLGLEGSRMPGEVGRCLCDAR